MKNEKQRQPKHRGDGEGSIFSRGDKWIAQVTFIAPDGTRKIVRRVADTQNAARQKLTGLKSDQDAHKLVITGRATVRNWLDVWLAEFIQPRRAPRTFCNYHDVLEQNLPERLSKMPLTKLAPEDLPEIVQHGRGEARADRRSAARRVTQFVQQSRAAEPAEDQPGSGHRPDPSR